LHGRLIDHRPGHLRHGTVTHQQRPRSGGAVRVFGPWLCVAYGRMQARAPPDAGRPQGQADLFGSPSSPARALRASVARVPCPLFP